jgi:capsular polysaccharide biosynthesis protein
VPTQHNYFHWLFEDLPSILRVLKVNKNICAVRASDLPSFQIEAINVFFDNPIILEKDWFIAEKLIVSPKTPIDFTNTNSRNVVDILQSTFLDLISPKIPRTNRIYISRKVNNLPKELEILLQNYLIAEGFRIIALEHLTFQDQVKLFSSAEFVVAPHGAGLSNLIWSTDRVKVFEIFMPNRFNECYRNLSNLLGHNYASVNLVESRNFTDIIKLLETFIASK